jgi:RNA polymerase sigma factor (sigma-70 family)
VCLPQAGIFQSRVFLRVVLHAAKEPPRDVEAWLFKACRNVLVDDARKRRGSRRQARPPREVPLEDEDTMIDETADPERSAAMSERRALFARAMQKVPAELATVIVMHEIEGQPVDEIAKKLGITEANVRGRLRRAEEKIERAARRDLASRSHGSRRGAVVPFSMVALFEAGRAFDPMPDSVRRRVGARIEEVLRAAAPSPSAGRAVPRHVGRLAALAARHGSAFIVGGATGALLYALLTSTPSAPRDPAPNIQPEPVVMVERRESTPPDAREQRESTSPDARQIVAPVASHRAPMASRSARQVATTDPDEASLLIRARSAYDRGDTDAAREALAEHTRRFPQSELAEQRADGRKVVQP